MAANSTATLGAALGFWAFAGEIAAATAAHTRIFLEKFLISVDSIARIGKRAWAEGPSSGDPKGLVGSGARFRAEAVDGDLLLMLELGIELGEHVPQVFQRLPLVVAGLLDHAVDEYELPLDVREPHFDARVRIVFACHS